MEVAVVICGKLGEITETAKKRFKGTGTFAQHPHLTK
jgi:hypothetical protein